MHLACFGDPIRGWNRPKLCRDAGIGKAKRRRTHVGAGEVAFSVKVDGIPLSSQRLSRFTRRIASGERIQNLVAALGQKLDEECWKPDRKSSTVWLDPMLPAGLKVLVSGAGVCDGDEIVKPVFKWSALEGRRTFLGGGSGEAQ